MTNIQDKSASVQLQIFAEDYYTQRYQECLKKTGITRIDVEKKLCSSDKLHSLWEAFWWSLPDSPSIRREPFFSICDICESYELDDM